MESIKFLLICWVTVGVILALVAAAPLNNETAADISLPAVAEAWINDTLRLGDICDPSNSTCVNNAECLRNSPNSTEYACACDSKYYKQDKALGRCLGLRDAKCEPYDDDSCSSGYECQHEPGEMPRCRKAGLTKGMIVVIVVSALSGAAAAGCVLYVYVRGKDVGCEQACCEASRVGLVLVSLNIFTAIHCWYMFYNGRKIGLHTLIWNLKIHFYVQRKCEELVHASCELTFLTSSSSLTMLKQACIRLQNCNRNSENYYFVFSTKFHGHRSSLACENPKICSLP